MPFPSKPFSFSYLLVPFGEAKNPKPEVLAVMREFFMNLSQHAIRMVSENTSTLADLALGLVLMWNNALKQWPSLITSGEVIESKD